MHSHSSHSILKRTSSILAVIILLIQSCTEKIETKIALDYPSEDQNSGETLINLQPGIALTFDDAYYDEWIEMLPILQKYDAKATFFICRNYPKYDPKSKEKILTLYNAGNEIGVHTLNHPHLSDYLKDHTLSEYYRNEILPDVRFLNALGINPGSFAFPYGEQNTEAIRYISQYFNKIRCMYGAPNIKTSGKVIGASLIWSRDLKDYKDGILFAKSDTGIWVVVEHKPVHEFTNKDTFTFRMLDSICRFVKEQNMRFYCLNGIDSAFVGKQRIRKSG
jgi:peptidoglycan-N-acetylglucosamine deacetylase